jgi:Zn-dependent protease
MFSNLDPYNIIVMIPAILIGFTFHEYAHALVADRLGDKTPRFQGRLTLNPFVHIDIMGFILILLVGLGWAKPVQTNPSAYKHYYKDDLKVSIAGPIANFFVAFVATVALAISLKLLSSTNMSSQLLRIINDILFSTMKINCMLFILNLIPIPGFDGFHILRDLFPKFFYNKAESMQKYQLIIFVILAVVPIYRGMSALSLILGYTTSKLLSFFVLITGII